MKAIHCPICKCELIVEFNGVVQEDNVDFALNHVKGHRVADIENYFGMLFAEEYLKIVTQKNTKEPTK